MIIFNNERDLDNAIEQGWIRQQSQGKNSNGKPRPEKFHIKLNEIDEKYIVKLDKKVDYKITEDITDKSGKATPIDRILIIAPESSKPKSLLDVEEISWSPFLISDKITKLSDFTS